MPVDLSEYRDFIAGKFIRHHAALSIDASVSDVLKSHQAACVEFALRHRKTAHFLDTGLGKTLIELDFARICAEETRKPSLILAPLAVAGQIVREGMKFGIEARQIREQSEVGAGHGEAIRNGYYHDPDTGKPIKYTVRELMALVIAELREAVIADVDGAMDRHLPHRLGVEVEIADALIILFGACGYLGLDIGNAIVEKLAFNRTRADHKPGARRAAGGKKC